MQLCISVMYMSYYRSADFLFALFLKPYTYIYVSDWISSLNICVIAKIEAC
jgi:hypothetical protein